MLTQRARVLTGLAPYAIFWPRRLTGGLPAASGKEPLLPELLLAVKPLWRILAVFGLALSEES